MGLIGPMRVGLMGATAASVLARRDNTSMLAIRTRHTRTCEPFELATRDSAGSSKRQGRTL
jgi:hypothetical protein